MKISKGIPIYAYEGVCSRYCAAIPAEHVSPRFGLERASHRRQVHSCDGGQKSSEGYVATMDKRIQKVASYSWNPACTVMLDVDIRELTLALIPVCPDLQSTIAQSSWTT